MASIGGQTVLRLVGQLEPGDGENVQDITRAGVDGRAYRKTGKRAPPAQVTTVVDLGGSAAVKAALAAYKALQGTLVTVVTESSGTYTNVMVKSVREVDTKRVMSAVGGTTAGTRLLACQWVLQMTETS
jgi:hypothetical protein